MYGIFCNSVAIFRRKPTRLNLELEMKLVTEFRKMNWKQLRRYNNDNSSHKFENLKVMMLSTVSHSLLQQRELHVVTVVTWFRVYLVT